MKARPVLFSAPMIRALLAGRKLQTRRTVKPQPKLSPHHEPARAEWRGDRRWVFMTHTDRPEYSWATGGVRCPYGEDGDLLIVKESAWMWSERRPNGVTEIGRPKWHYVPMREAPIHYAADHPSKPATNIVSPDTGCQWGWRLKIGRFLPAWASRSTLRITNVRVERLQEISRDDCIAEGIVPWHSGDDPPCYMLGPGDDTGAFGKPGSWKPKATPQLAYRALWEHINGAESWAENPWVWALTFDVVKANVDQVMREAA